MNYFELIGQRYSYRGNYTSKKIPRQDLNLILSAGLNAPSGCNAQTTEFVVIDDTAKIQRISEILGKDNISSASAIILSIINKTPKNVYGDMSFEIEDSAAAVMSMLLAITELGYASVWIDGQLRRDNNAEKIGELIALPPEKKVEILLPVGEAAAPAHQPKKKGEEERVSFNSYSL